MTRAPKPIQEVARLLDLVPYLSVNPDVEISQLAREFGVSEREITQEVTALALCGLPGYTHLELMDVAISDGRVTLYNYETLDIPRALTKLEIASFLLGLELLREKSGDHPELLLAIEKLISQLTVLVGEIVDVEIAGEAKDVDTIQRAIAARGAITFRYTSALDGEGRDRLISPLDLYRQGTFSYIRGYCHESKEIRNFRLDRVDFLAQAEAPQSHLPDSSQESSPNSALKLVAHGNLRAVSETLSIEKIESGREFDYLAFSPQWVEYATTALAPDLEILAPRHSREQVAQRLTNILALYRS